MRERGEKVDRATIKEATDVGMDTLGKSTREREQEQVSEKQAQAEESAAMLRRNPLGAARRNPLGEARRLSLQDGLQLCLF